MRVTQKDRAPLNVLRHIWLAGRLRVQSDYARRQAAGIAMAASLGLITTHIGKARYDRDWRLTSKGLELLEPALQQKDDRPQ